MEQYHDGHPYLRAYMAGVTIPALLLVIVMLLYILARLVWQVPVPLEQVLVFPMAVVPNVWGLWNMLYVGLHLGRRVPIGWFGAIIPLLLMPVGWFLAGTIGVAAPVSMLLAGIVVVAAIYYVLWRYLVAALNELVGLGRELPAHAV